MSINKKLKIGVLDIQGSVEEHTAVLHKLGLSPVAVKRATDLEGLHGLIIPGGESTTIGKLMKAYGLLDPISKRATQKKNPLCIWGTCAGAILIAKKVYNRPPDHMKLMDIEIERNAYGRQMDSFETMISIPVLGKKEVHAVFIRAPKIKRLNKEVRVLAEYNGVPVMLEEKNLLVTMFHPELTSDTRVHNYFLTLTSHYAF